MGVRAGRWQLWLITMFILTGIIGMIQLFKGPESAGAVRIAGGAVNSSIGLPSRSSAEQATQLPAWAPTDDTSANAPERTKSQNNDVPKVAAATTSVVAKTVTMSASPTTAKPTTKAGTTTATKATKATKAATKPPPTTVRKTTAAP